MSDNVNEVMAVAIKFEDVAQWSNDLTMRIKCGEWDPDKWPPDMRALHRKICAATFLAHDLTKESIAPLPPPDSKGAA